MKFKKRITAVAVAIIMAVSGAMSMTVSADIGSHQTSSYIVVSYYTVTTPTASTKYIQSVGTVTNLSSTTASYSVQATLYAQTSGGLTASVGPARASGTLGKGENVKAQTTKHLMQGYNYGTRTVAWKGGTQLCVLDSETWMPYYE